MNEATERVHLWDRVGAGIIAGLIAGVLMGLFAMIRSAAIGEGFWFPMQLIAGLYYGVTVVLGGAGITILGIVTHLIVSACWGFLFALIFAGRWSAPAAAIIGLAYASAVFGFMTYVILPWANPTMFARVTVFPVWFWAYHAVYGLTLGLSPGIAHEIHRGHAPVPAGATS